jgi:hypothetical protein
MEGHMSGTREMISGPSRWLRWVHEYMFALNLVWIVVWIERVRTKALGGPVLAHWVFAFGHSIYQHVFINNFTIMDQLIWSFAMASVVFFLLRFFSLFSGGDFAMRTIAGAAAIAAYPIATLFYGLAYPDCCNEAARIVFSLEVIIVLICGILFYLRKGRISGPLMIVALALHFTLWAWITSSYFNIPEFVSATRTAYYHPSWRRTLASLGLEMVFTFGFPAFGFLASFTWVRYLSGSTQNNSSQLLGL